MIYIGQHYNSNMSNVFFIEMKISKPKYCLGSIGIKLMLQLQTDDGED